VCYTDIGLNIVFNIYFETTPVYIMRLEWKKKYRAYKKDVKL
jgi:hypothetical protein